MCTTELTRLISDFGSRRRALSKTRSKNTFFRNSEEGRPAAPGWTDEGVCPYAILAAGPGDLGQGSGLTVMPDFHDQRQHQDDRTNGERDRKRNVTIGKTEVGRCAVQLGDQHHAYKRQQETQGE